jgi:NAD(P)-dependent dehydrogenase (short-subunit alcohol dehydrogenase family)
MTQIDGAVAVVTGGASGIGRGIAEALITEGARVVIADIDAAALEATAAEIGATAIRCDVSDAATVAALAAGTIERFGHVEIVVNNAGVGPMAPIADLTLSDWRWMLDINLWGVIHGVHTFLPLLLANPRPGHIVNTASMAAFAPNPPLGAYAASKAAVVALTDVLAAEMAAAGGHVGVTLLAPANTRTAIARSQRNRPDAGALKDVDLAVTPGFTAGARWLEPGEVGGIVVRAIAEDERYAITHPEQLPRVTERYEALKAAFERAPDRLA